MTPLEIGISSLVTSGCHRNCSTKNHNTLIFHDLVLAEYGNSEMYKFVLLDLNDKTETKMIIVSMSQNINSFFSCGVSGGYIKCMTLFLITFILTVFFSFFANTNKHEQYFVRKKKTVVKQFKHYGFNLR